MHNSSYETQQLTHQDTIKTYKIMSLLPIFDVTSKPNENSISLRKSKERVDMELQILCKEI